MIARELRAEPTSAIKSLSGHRMDNSDQTSSVPNTPRDQFPRSSLGQVPQNHPTWASQDSRDLNLNETQATAISVPVSWTYLPVELWRSVCDVLNREECTVAEEGDIIIKKDPAIRDETATKKDYASISLVCRLLHRIVEEYLYQSFSWIPYFDKAWPPLDVLKERNLKEISKSKRDKRAPFPWRCGPPPYLLLRTILNRPNLAQYFKSVKILGASPTSGLFWNMFEAREGSFSGKEFDLCEKTISRMPDVSRRHWLSGLQKGRLDVFVGLLLLRLSRSKKLKTIDIRIRECSTLESVVFDALDISCIMQAVSRYASVTSVTFSMDKDEKKSAYVDLEDHTEMDMYHVDRQVWKLLKFPRLESLALHLCSPCHTWQTRLPIASHLRKLTLKYGAMEATNLGTLLSSTPQLEELDCDLVYDRSINQRLDCEKLNRSLSKVHDTLAYLTIGLKVLWPDTEDGDGPWDVLKTMGSMKHFRKLTWLNMPLITLIPKVPTIPGFHPGPNILERNLPESLISFYADREPTPPDVNTQREAERIVVEYVSRNVRLMENLRWGSKSTTELGSQAILLQVLYNYYDDFSTS
ncbi:uncharacterized protein LY89DRAFT_729226 [Mollisia scopiformis]|uniref:Uncharacterized protein n=1 Tax=Mollisia scopiformis TaxID=149040 RepID=A0A194XNJ3_MOLSC|nr:uncharacterized protein LY89DRAFT_729226 [Mollisia scopiformis]KUJ21721.1 hypothetical protein LY89DRAFT_729226 [Mollisia scopiformis]